MVVVGGAHHHLLPTVGASKVQGRVAARVSLREVEVGRVVVQKGQRQGNLRCDRQGKGGLL